MRLSTEAYGLCASLIVLAGIVSSASAQPVDVIQHLGDADERELAEEREAEANGVSSEAEAAEPTEPTEPAETHRAYRTGSEDLPLQVGGHLFAAVFTLPETPELEPGFGLETHAAMNVVGSVVVEGNVALMKSSGATNAGRYTTAYLRLGGRLPIDVGADAFLLFGGLGAAIEYAHASTTDATAGGVRRSKSGFAPAFDLQLGLTYAVAERIALEGIVRGTYAFPTVALGDNEASWLSFLIGATYDL